MIYIGTTGWDYKFWNKSFYPESIDKKLPFYSEISAFTELRSTYTEIPSEQKVLNWFNATPESFIFVSRLLRTIIDTNDLSINESLIEEFFSAFAPLGNKHQMTLLHFPMKFQKNEETETFLYDLLTTVGKAYSGQLLVEAPNRSWQKIEVRDELAKRSACLVGNDRRPIPSLMRDKSVYYLRLMGDKRTVPRDEFGENPLDRDDDIHSWADHIKFIDSNTEAVFVAIDNHFSGNAIADSKLMATTLQNINASYKGFMVPN